MKKIIVMFMLCILMVGCGNQKVTDLDINKTKEIIENKLSGMQEIEKDTLKTVYGFDDTLVEDYVFKQNKDGDMYALIKTSDKAKIKSNMKSYFEKVRQFNASYSPERLRILDNRLEKEIGNYLIYIVASNAENIYSEILKSL